MHLPLIVNNKTWEKNNHKLIWKPKLMGSARPTVEGIYIISLLQILEIVIDGENWKRDNPYIQIK